MGRCNGITLLGKRCRKHVQSGNYCYLHKQDNKTKSKNGNIEKKKEKYPIYWIIRYEISPGEQNIDESYYYHIVGKTNSKKERDKLLKKYRMGHIAPGTYGETYYIKQNKDAKYITFIIGGRGIYYGTVLSMTKKWMKDRKNWTKVTDNNRDHISIHIQEGFNDDQYILYNKSEGKLAVVRPLEVNNIDDDIRYDIDDELEPY